MAMFYACQKFYDQTPNDELEPLLEQYKQYLRNLKPKMQRRRREDRGTLRRLSAQHPDDDMNILKGALHKSYVEEYPDAQYDENPYDDLEDSDDEYDSNESQT